ncbi:hypothetical protein ES703_10013 [subsurface metagenome]
MVKVTPIMTDKDREIVEEVYKLLIKQCHYRPYALKILRLLRYRIIDEYETSKEVKFEPYE